MHNDLPLTEQTHQLICITVCTRERPQMLSRLIDSYLALKIPPHTRIRLEIVENDTESRIEPLVSSKNVKPSHPIGYSREPRLGIPIARNRCVDIAFSNHASHIAFVDDDEWLPEDWLHIIWEYYLSRNPDCVIQGPVLSRLPPGTPPFFLGIIQRKIKQTGAPLHMCMTNNVLVPMTMFANYELRFDETYPLAGGTDSKLFRLARSKGVELVYCSEAFVYEEVPAARVTYRWLSKRNFRIGLTLGEHTKFENSRQRALHITSKFFKGLHHTIKSIGYLVLWNRSKHWKNWLKGCKFFGECLGPLGVKINSYTKIEGS